MKNKITITILLSTYNGEKYLCKLLDSLLNQQNVSFRLIVRDDGSQDKTIEILKQYKNNNMKLISYYEGSNIGSTQSFFSLLCNSPDSDYYAFCDQDDIWDKDKLEIAISMLKKLDNNKPALYFSNLRIIDDNDVFIRTSHNKPLQLLNEYSPLIESLPSGCTMVFNKAAKKIICNNIPKNCSVHDSWIYMVCAIFGSIVYDFNPHISYRIHKKNTIGSYKKKSMVQYIIRLVNVFRSEKESKYIDACSFLECYGNKLNTKMYSKLKEICDYKKSFRSTLKLIFDKDLKYSSKYRFVISKIMILLKIY